MHRYELLDAIRKRPAFYIDDDKSIKRLRSFLVGYDVGLAQHSVPSPDEFVGFNDWIASQFGYSNSTAGWCNMILDKAGSDEKAFDLFFELLDKFRAEGSPKPKHLRTA
jgi:hypothetical protein